MNVICNNLKIRAVFLRRNTTNYLLLSSKIFSLRPFNSVPSSFEMAFFISLRDANSTTLYLGREVVKDQTLKTKTKAEV